MKKMWISKNSGTTMNKHLLSEALEYKDMVGIVKPTVHIDEFASKMGDDADIIVVSFFVRNQQAARDLVDWFEKGYDWVLDADRSPGEISPGRYLVYVEMRRRSTAGRRLATMLDDLTTLTEHAADTWVMTYNGKDLPFSEANFDRVVPLSPRQYREQRDSNLNEMRVAAGIEPRITLDITPETRALQAAAGI
jgi:hypothetical protein